MLVEINLLPQKEPKNRALLIILFSSMFILLAAGPIIFWQGTRLDTELNSLDNQIKTAQKLVEAEQVKQEKQNLALGSLTQLESAVQWANDEPLKSAPILKDLIALLPERGFIQNISYTEAGAISLTVQFDTSREAAYFYKTLLDSEWIAEAKLSSLATNEPKQQAAAEGETSEADEQYIPRYTGQYSITLNRQYINSEEKLRNSELSGQGGGEL